MATEIGISAAASRRINDYISHIKSLAIANQDLVSGKRSNPAESPDKDLMGKSFAGSEITAASRLDILTQAAGVVQYAIGGVEEFESILSTLQGIAEKAANSSNSDAAREALQAQFIGNLKALDELSKMTLNDAKLIDGSLSSGNNLKTNIEGLGKEGTSAKSTISFSLEDKVFGGTLDTSTPSATPDHYMLGGDLRIETDAKYEFGSGAVIGGTGATLPTGPSAAYQKYVPFIPAHTLFNPKNDFAVEFVAMGTAPGNDNNAALTITAGSKNFTVKISKTAVDPSFDATNGTLTLGFDMKSKTGTPAALKFNDSTAPGYNEFQAFAKAVHEADPLITVKATAETTIAINDSGGDKKDAAAYSVKISIAEGGFHNKNAASDGCIKTYTPSDGTAAVTDPSSFSTDLALDATRTEANFIPDQPAKPETLYLGGTLTSGAEQKELAALLGQFLSNNMDAAWNDGQGLIDPEGNSVTLPKERADAFSKWIPEVNDDVIKLSSVKEGEVIGFSQDSNSDINVFSEFDTSASGGSLASVNAIAKGSADISSVLEQISGKRVKSALTTINLQDITDGATVSFLGRTFTFKEMLSPGNRDDEILLPTSDPLQALKNMVVKFNISNDPSISAFQFSLQTSSKGGSITAKLQINSIAETKTFNNAVFKIMNSSGTTSSSIKLEGGSAGGLDVSSVTSNPGFHGKISGFSVAPKGTGVEVKVTVGDYTYSSAIDDPSLQTATTLQMTSSDALGGYFTMKLKANPEDVRGNPLLAGKEGSILYKALSGALDGAFSSVDIKQKRSIDSFQPEKGSVLDGTKAELLASNFTNNINITSCEITPSIGDKTAFITIKSSDGKVYESLNDASKIGQSIYIGRTIELLEKNTNGRAADSILLTFSSEIDMTDSDKVALLQKDLSRAFKTGASPLEVQISDSSVLVVEIPDFSFNTLFGSDNPNDPNLTVSSLDSAKKMTALIKNIKANVSLKSGQLAATFSTVMSNSRVLQAQRTSLQEMRDLYLNKDRQESSALYAELQNMIDLDLYGLANDKRLQERLVASIVRGG